MRQRPFKQVDVFTATPYFGNPLAVVLDGSGLDDEAMRRFAHRAHPWPQAGAQPRCHAANTARTGHA